MGADDDALRVFEEAGGEEGVVEDLLGDELGGFALGGIRFGFGELADDGVAGVDFEDDVGGGEGAVFVHGAHHLTELGCHFAIGGEDEGGGAEEAFARADGFDTLGEGFFEPVAEAGGGVFAEGFAFGGVGVVAEVDLVGIDGVEGFAFELAEGGDDVFVDGFVEVDDFEAFGFEAFDVGAGFDGGA